MTLPTWRFFYRAEVATFADRHGLDADLVTALCMHEGWDGRQPAGQQHGVAHAFRFEPQFWLRYMAHKPEWDGAVPMRVSSSYGLMQVMYATALDVGYPRKDAPEGLFVPTINLEYGCRILRDRFDWAGGDEAAALAAYNGGKTRDNAPGVAQKRNGSYVEAIRVWIDRVRAGQVTG